MRNILKLMRNSLKNKSLQLAKLEQYYRIDPILRPIIDLFINVLKSNTYTRHDLSSLSIPQYPSLINVLQGPNALPVLADLLWRLCQTNIIRSVNLNQKILEIFSTETTNDIFIRICRSNKDSSLEIVASSSIYKTLLHVNMQNKAFRNLAISVGLWDNSFENKLNII